MRPTFSASTRPASASTRRCWLIADRVTVNSPARSVTPRGPRARSCRIRRRLGSAAAESESVTTPDTLVVTNVSVQRGESFARRTARGGPSCGQEGGCGALAARYRLGSALTSHQFAVLVNLLGRQGDSSPAPR